MRNYFILNGVDSRDFGVYISGQGTFDAPQKSYTFYNVPGRDGALLSSDNRLENATLTYEAFIYKDFNENVANFRTFLLSLNGYAKLTDSYHPDEFRYAVYTGPFEPKVQSKNDAGSFKITFSCKPQRYLLSGEAEWDVGTNSTTVRGGQLLLNAASVDSSIANLYLTFRPISGTKDNPVSFTPYTDAMLWYTMYQQGGINMIYDSEITATESGLHPLLQDYGVVGGSIDLLTGSGTASLVVTKLPSSNWTRNGQYWEHSALIGIDNIVACSHYLASDNDEQNSIRIENLVIKIKDKSLNPHFGSVYVVGQPSNTVNLSADVFTPNYPVSDLFRLVANPPGAEIEVGYSSSELFNNPTYMKAQPLFFAYGTGSFTVNDVTVTISSATPIQNYTIIDSEMMDCYETTLYGTVNRNDIVSFSTYDFPVLYPGDNTIKIVSGITKLIVKPRWWRV